MREHLQLSLPKDLSDYEIDRINDIENPNDDTVAGKPFHSMNFQPAKHSLVVKLRTKVCRPESTYNRPSAIQVSNLH